MASALPTIGRDLGDVRSLPWLITAYLLASTAVIPLYGKIADIHGRRFTLRIAILTYMAGSLLCALAPNMLTLIFARALHGLGGGGLLRVDGERPLDLAELADIGRVAEVVDRPGDLAVGRVQPIVASLDLGGIAAEGALGDNGQRRKHQHGAEAGDGEGTEVGHGEDSEKHRRSADRTPN